MGLSRTVSEIYREFNRKSQNFPKNVYFAPTLTGFPLELGISARNQKLEWWGYQVEKEVFRYIFSYLDTIHERDRRTDGQTPDDSKDRAYA